MNIVAILLGIVMIILVYVLYKYFTNTASTLNSYVNLNATQPAITNIGNPTSVSYAYGIWVYVNSYNTSSTGNAPKVIFSRAQNIALYLDANTPTLKCDVYMSNAKWLSETQNGGTPITITNNFPLQKWVYVTISMDGPFLDAYLDGKLVVSNNLQNNGIIPKIPPDAVATTLTGVPTSGAGQNIYVGSGGTGPSAIANNRPWDAYAAKFQRWTSALAPNEVWSAYLGGNGLSASTTSYGVNMSVLKNNITQGTYQLI